MQQREVRRAPPAGKYYFVKMGISW